MDHQDGRYRVLAGDPPKHGWGVWAAVTCETASGLNDGSEQEAFERAGAAAFLAVPFLRVLGEPGQRRLVIGQVRVSVASDREAAVTLALYAIWSDTGGWHQEPNSLDQADDTLIGSLSEPAHVIAGDAQTTAVIMGKAFAEAARNEVLKLRFLRYDIERQIADLLAQRSNAALRPLLAQMIELSMAVSRAGDHAREALRDGLWIWLWDDDTYKRRNTEFDQTAGGPRWEATYRAALRHPEAMVAQLTEEASKLHGLLNSMSTFAVAQDSEDQQKFNLIVAVAAAGLGVPALILTLYGAQSYLPLDSFDHAWRALLPVGVVMLAAVLLALRRIPGGARRRHYALALTLVVALIATLLFAGAFTPRP